LDDAVINPQKFEKGEDKKYTLAPFKPEDIIENTLKNAREKKVRKYEPIIKEANEWLQANIEEIRIKHKVSSANVEAKFIIISSLGIIPKTTERDVCDIVSSDKKEKL
jgi:HSP90 family molecular chaperone